jgi:hypothetical protein
MTPILISISLEMKFFLCSFEHDNDYLSSEIFLSRMSIAEMVYFGRQNYTFRELSCGFSSHDVVTETLVEMTIVYEDDLVSDVSSVNDDDFSVSISSNLLNE